jgi:hypothetical protein
MAAAVRSFALAALVLAGCAKGDSLVVVTVNAMPAISNVAVLKTTSKAGGQTFLQDVGASAVPFSLGAGVTKSFAVQVPSSITGAFSIHVEAHNASGSVLAQCDGMATLSPGNRVNIPITLVPAAIQPPAVVDSVWIGSGGSAATSSYQLSVSTGGNDTIGEATAASGAAFVSGLFASQTN